ncbi:MAG TPA: hypothetical protein DEE98_03355 [Elusimicrobia bacterium]|nr:MAG: hypothetical protein A2278_08170 [Elusimicrobia bacterium RIFOXYA12_FULL_49_49]OGS09883.1 MAG: hypothetical protein A2204_05555 [Elusimicrobia bacterium RIFOXYA1_FULL_47_7]OGS11054.1 MAG: hypothetical protein A2386_04305 [Elusimicrobia bacterium RIFOXYB1_FULL_48_9]OGS15960.1 MAG: hypothetical protein A2251_02095 [Elusimicrobia bacterium RIFOXYA2_FULL_47_53]OGS26360.1 MAG: hypothetical protein A2339_03170 [Elusimicrobia bacterium RIFOXYB12_FULL_50_12]OGS29128.1 MAG: hypothetical protein
MKKVLLLNPPGRKLYIREYFCSKVSQADYIPHPVDLVMLSGVLSGKFALELIDAITGKLSEAGALEAAAAVKPEAVICLVGAASLSEDLAFLKALRPRLPNAKIIAIGDVFREDARKRLGDYPFIDAVLLDFTSEDIVLYLEGNTSSLPDIVTADSVETAYPVKKGSYSVGIPDHKLFLKYNYRHPFVRSRRFATVLTDYGCPFKCTFCVMGTLGFAVREVDNIMRELEAIVSLGTREVLFQTQTFGANKKQAVELCERIIKSKLGLGWVCFSRVDVTTPELLDKMKRAGCHTIIFGIESGADKILSAYQKGYTAAQAEAVIEYCDRIGIETAGTFILGLPEETRETLARTLSLIKRIRLDYASFNVAVPRAGTGLRKEAIGLGLAGENTEIMDQSGSDISMPTKTLSRAEILKFRRKAVAAFYFSPKNLVRRIFKARSLPMLLRNFSQGLSLIRNTWFS